MMSSLEYRRVVARLTGQRWFRFRSTYQGQVEEHLAFFFWDGCQGWWLNEKGDVESPSNFTPDNVERLVTYTEIDPPFSYDIDTSNTCQG